MVLHLGYLEATYMDLTGREFGSGGSTEKRPIAMNHIYEISLLAPGEGLQNIYDCFNPLHESEGLMREIMLNNVTTKNKEEMGILSVITEQSLIRRAYLNDTMVEVKIDTCSMASVVVTENPKISRILRIKRKLRIQPLFQGNKKIGQGFGTGHKVDEERMGDRSKEVGKSGKKLLLASDDPRRGGRIGYSDKYEEEFDQSSLAKQRISKDLRKRVS